MRLLCLLISPLFISACASTNPKSSAWMLSQGGGQSYISADTTYVASSKDLKSYKGRKPIDILRGRATYYSDSLIGNHTASGERYDARALTAANRDLPFGTIVRVVRLSNRRAVIVRINDRGPFRDRSRILDLSRAAAKELQMLRDGVVDVRAEILEYGKSKRAKKTR